MSQISDFEKKQESKYLERVIGVLSNEYLNIDNQYNKRADNLKDYRRHLWENRRDFNDLFDIAEYEDSLREDLRGYEAIKGRRSVIINALKSPYFARIDFEDLAREEKEKIYIGLTSIIENESFNILVMDWRAPISSVYYDYELGVAEYEAPSGLVKGIITLKRQFKIKDGELILAVDTGIRIDDTLLLEALGESSNVKMQQIVYTIQQEQNKIIRDNTSKTMWIQGVAGSGKTSVALHRIAYLLYHSRGIEKINAENIAIFSPHPVFSDYISDVLPDLGEDKATQLTFFDFAQAKLNKEVEIEDISDQYLALEKFDRERIKLIEYKSSKEFLKTLELYIDSLEKKVWEFQDIIFAGYKVFTKEEAEELFNERYSHLPLSKRLDYVVNRIIYLVSLKYKKVNESQLRLTIYENAPKLDALKLYRELFYDLSIWPKINVEDLPEDFVTICKKTVEAIDEQLLFYEDIAPVLLLKHKIEEKIPNDGYLHLVIDEIQTYSIVQLKLFKEVFENSKFTFLGDIYQKMNPAIVWSIDDVKEILGDNIVFHHLNRCYRSTMQIAKLAKSVYPESDMVFIEREGITPRIKIVNQDSVVQSLKDRVDEALLKEGESIAIITDTLEEASFLVDNLSEYEIKLITGSTRGLSKAINVLPAHMIKGLEFDVVIYVNQSQAAIDNKAYLYTIITRALHEFNIIATEEMPLLQEPLNQGYILKED